MRVRSEITILNEFISDSRFDIYRYIDSKLMDEVVRDTFVSLKDAVVTTRDLERGTLTKVLTISVCTDEDIKRRKIILKETLEKYLSTETTNEILLSVNKYIFD